MRVTKESPNHCEYLSLRTQWSNLFSLLHWWVSQGSSADFTFEILAASSRLFWLLLELVAKSSPPEAIYLGVCFPIILQIRYHCKPVYRRYGLPAGRHGWSIKKINLSQQIKKTPTLEWNRRFFLFIQEFITDQYLYTKSLNKYPEPDTLVYSISNKVYFNKFKHHT